MLAWHAAAVAAGRKSEGALAVIDYPHIRPRAVVHRSAAEIRVARIALPALARSEEHTSELQSHHDLVCRLLLEKKKTRRPSYTGRRPRRPRGSSSRRSPRVPRAAGGSRTPGRSPPSNQALRTTTPAYSCRYRTS